MYIYIYPFTYVYIYIYINMFSYTLVYMHDHTCICSVLQQRCLHTLHLRLPARRPAQSHAMSHSTRCQTQLWLMLSVSMYHPTLRSLKNDTWHFIPCWMSALWGDPLLSSSGITRAPNTHWEPDRTSLTSALEFQPSAGKRRERCQVHRDQPVQRSLCDFVSQCEHVNMWTFRTKHCKS